MAPTPLPLDAAFRTGWRAMRRHLPLSVALVAVTLVLDAIGARARRSAPPEEALVNLVVQLVQVLLAMTWIRVALALHDGATLDWTAPFVEARALLGRYWRFLATSLLYGLIVAGGLILFVVPGVVWAVKYAFAGFAVVDADLAPVAALRRSARLTEGHKAPLLGFGLLLLLANVVGAALLGVGLVATMPMTAVAAATIYRRLAAEADARARTPAAPLPAGPSVEPRPA